VRVAPFKLVTLSMDDRKPLKPRKSWTPAAGFAAVVVGVIVALWWMGRPSSAIESPLPSSARSAQAPVQADPLPSDSAPLSDKRDLCNLDQVKKFLTSQLSGAVSDSDLTEVAQEIMAELGQARMVEKGCVSQSAVAAALYELADETQEPQ
jgi:hypothetical protein